MWSIGLWLVALFLLGSTVSAEVYKCPDGKGGTVLRDVPCSAEAGRAASQPHSSRGTTPRWEVQEGRDTMTNEQSCTLFSPARYVLATHRQVIALRIAVAFTRSHRPLVTLVSGASASRLSFHKDIHGLGLRIDSSPFVPIDIKGNQSVLAFLPERSQQLLPQLQTGKVAKFRVRFWPYDETFDGEISLAGFAEEYEALTRCEAAAQ